MNKEFETAEKIYTIYVIINLINKMFYVGSSTNVKRRKSEHFSRLNQNKNKRNNKFFKAVSPNGEEFISDCQKEFSLQHNVHHTGINGCLNGRLQKYKGWKFKFIEGEKNGLCA